MPANVVLVHDNPQFLNEVAAALREAGLTVAPFSEPMDGLDALKSANVAQIFVPGKRMPVTGPLAPIDTVVTRTKSGGR